MATPDFKDEEAMLARRVPFLVGPSGRFAVGGLGGDHNSVPSYLLEQAGDLDDVEDLTTRQGHLLFLDEETLEIWPAEDGERPLWLSESLKVKVRARCRAVWSGRRARSASRQLS